MCWKHCKTTINDNKIPVGIVVKLEYALLQKTISLIGVYFKN